MMHVEIVCVCLSLSCVTAFLHYIYSNDLPLYCGQKFIVPGLFGVLWYRCSVCIMSTHSASLSLILAPNGYSGGGSNAVIRFNFVSPLDFRIIQRPHIAATCAPSECPITWNFSTSNPSSTQSKIVSDSFVASYRRTCVYDPTQFQIEKRWPMRHTKKKHAKKEKKTEKNRRNDVEKKWSNMEIILEIFFASHKTECHRALSQSRR